VLAVTVTVIVVDELSPGLGLPTLTAYVPAVASVPVAVSCVDDTYVVASAAPAHSTAAPFTKLLPFTVSVNDPAVKLEGETLAIVGVGFSSVTALDPEALASACEIAVTVIVLGFGTAAGAVYTPEELIVPADEFPPATPFTDHVTPWFVDPVTAAANVCVAPARTFAVVGLTDTLTVAGGVLVCVPVLPHPS
jgi:hypothetical protein